MVYAGGHPRGANPLGRSYLVFAKTFVAEPPAVLVSGRFEIIAPLIFVALLTRINAKAIVRTLDGRGHCLRHLTVEPINMK